MELNFAGQIQISNAAVLDTPIVKGLSDPNVYPTEHYLLPGHYYEILDMDPSSDTLYDIGARENKIGEIFRAIRPIATNVGSGKVILRHLVGRYSTPLKQPGVMEYLGVTPQGNLSGDITGLYPVDANDMLAQVAAAGRLQISGKTTPGEDLPYIGQYQSGTLASATSIDDGARAALVVSAGIPITYDGQYRNCMVDVISPADEHFRGKIAASYVATRTIIVELDETIPYTPTLGDTVNVYSLPVPGTIWMVCDIGTSRPGCLDGDLIMSTLPGMAAKSYLSTRPEDQNFYDNGCWVKLHPREGAILESFITISNFSIYPGGLYVASRPSKKNGEPLVDRPAIGWSPITQATNALRAVSADSTAVRFLEENINHLWAYFPENTVRRITVDVLAKNLNTSNVTAFTREFVALREPGSSTYSIFSAHPGAYIENQFVGLGVQPEVQMITEEVNGAGMGGEFRLFLETFIRPIAPDYRDDGHAYSSGDQVTYGGAVYHASVDYPADWAIGTYYRLDPMVPHYAKKAEGFDPLGYPVYSFWKTLLATPANWVTGTTYGAGTYVRYDNGGTIEFYYTSAGGPSVTTPDVDAEGMWDLVSLEPGSGAHADLFWTQMDLAPDATEGAFFWTEYLFDIPLSWRATMRWTDLTDHEPTP